MNWREPADTRFVLPPPTMCDRAEGSCAGERRSAVSGVGFLHDANRVRVYEAGRH